MKRGECFVAESDVQIIGVYVLLPTRPETVKLVHIGVIEEQHGKRLGKQLVMDAIRLAKSKEYRIIEIGKFKHWTISPLPKMLF